MQCKPLNNDGERMLPEHSDAYIFWEHVYRYRFAARFVLGKEVLDIACGAGYGSAGLSAAGARHVTGVDIDANAVSHAKTVYHVDARVGTAEAIPVCAGTVDVIVSFETIEHLASPHAMIKECHRILAPGGILVMSTPDSETYSECGHHNPYHLSEMTEQEFAAALSGEFNVVEWWDQGRVGNSWLQPAMAFSADSPYMSTRAGRAVRRVLQSLFEPRYNYEPRATDRADPAAWIARPMHSLATWVIPFAVRRRRPHVKSQARYLIAVARKH